MEVPATSSLPARTAAWLVSGLSPLLGPHRARRWIGQSYAVATLVYYNLRGQYARAMLGVLWAFLTPFLFMLVYIPLFTYVFNMNTGVLGGDELTFPLYVVVGFLAWGAIQEGVSNGAASLVYNPSVVRHSPAPPSTLPLVKVVGSFVGMVLGLGIMLVFLTAIGRFPGIRLVLAPVAILLLFAFTWGIAMLTSALAMILRDVLQMISTLLIIEFFACPLIYPITMVPEHIRPLATYNPVTPFLSLIRASFLREQPFAWLDLGLACGWTAAACLVGLLVFRRLEPSFGDHS